MVRRWRSTGLVIVAFLLPASCAGGDAEPDIRLGSDQAVATVAVTTTSTTSTTTSATAPATPSTTTAPTTGAPSTTPSDLDVVVAHGVVELATFDNGTLPHEAWTSGPIAFYAPVGWATTDEVTRWLGWYRRIDDLYRQATDRSDFERVYREEDANFGLRRVLAVVDAEPMFCGGRVEAAGCGAKSKAQAARAFMAGTAVDPNDVTAHWVLIYEMGRGGAFESFEGRAIWPPQGWAKAFPHLMAGVAFHDIGGDQALGRATPGDLLTALDAWEATGFRYTEVFPDEADTSPEGFIAHDLVAAMLYRILQASNAETVFAILAEVATKPPALEPVGAMCDFQDAVNTATDGRFAEDLVVRWGLPVCR